MTKPKPRYRSGLEADNGAFLEEQGVAFEYETKKLEYTITSKYTPDFILPNGIIVECKGRFKKEDRRKMRAVIAQNPDLDIRMVFSRSASKLDKGAKQTYGEWCEHWGIPYADKLIPEEWLKETK